MAWWSTLQAAPVRLENDGSDRPEHDRPEHDRPEHDRPEHDRPENPVSAETTGGGALAGTRGYINQPGLRVLGIPGRRQIDDYGGYCGEISVQMIMLKHGAWLPQAAMRRAAGGEALPGVNYDRGLNNLGIKYVKFSGRNANSFFAFAKQQLLQDHGVVQVMYLAGSRNGGYDHITPLVGVKYTKAQGYDANDVFYAHTNYANAAVQRKAGGYSCSNGNKQPLNKAGCVPNDTKYGYGLIGPQYLGIGPPVELHSVSPDSETGTKRRKANTNSKGDLTANLTVRRLTSGKQYSLYRINKPCEDIKGSKNGGNAGMKAPGRQRPGGKPEATFQASGTTWTIKGVPLYSTQVSYFICVEG